MMDQDYIKKNIRDLHSNWYMMIDGNQSHIREERTVPFSSSFEFFTIKLMEYCKIHNDNKFIRIDNINLRLFKEIVGEVAYRTYPDPKEQFDSVIAHLSTLRRMQNHKHNHPWKTVPIDELVYWKYSKLDLEFEYKLNTYGFRKLSDEALCTKDSAWAFGCSHTFGVGNPLNHTWPYQIQNKLQIPVFNFGIPGTGIDASYRLLKNWLDVPGVQKPKYVFSWGWYENRYEDLNKYSLYIPWIFYDEDDYRKNAKILAKNKQLIKQFSKLCEEHGIKHINQDIYMDFAGVSLCEETQKKFSEQYLPLARDLSHFGPMLQHKIAEIMTSKI